MANPAAAAAVCLLTAWFGNIWHIVLAEAAHGERTCRHCVCVCVCFTESCIYPTGGLCVLSWGGEGALRMCSLLIGDLALRLCVSLMCSVTSETVGVCVCVCVSVYVCVHTSSCERLYTARLDSLLGSSTHASPAKPLDPLFSLFSCLLLLPLCWNSKKEIQPLDTGRRAHFQ